MRSTPSRTAVCLAALLVAAPLAALAVPASAQTGSVKLMVLGETHGTKSMTKSLVGIAQSKGATGCVCPGDFIYGHWETSASAWRDMMRPFMGNMMPAQGNHDWPWSDWSSMFPGGRHYYAKDVNGVQFISVNTEYSLAPGSAQRTWLDARLAERDDSALKVVFMHRPWWLPEGARHPMSEFHAKNGESPSAMFSLMERHGVDLVVSAHEKNYQHSARNGVHYLVAGGGGPEFYSMAYDLPGAVKRLKSNVVSTLDVTPTSMTIKSYDLGWNKVEEFTMTGSGAAPAPAPAPSPAPGGAASLTWRSEGGNEWWVQAYVGGADAARVAKVESRDTGGAWVALSKRSWGPYAGSYHVEPGHAVQHRATLSDGRVAESCWFTHPAGACTSAPSTGGSTPSTGAFSATFQTRGGNDWWVAVKVGATQPLAGVDARVNGGAWKPLAKQPWGEWAASFHAPSGSLVDFRARSTSGGEAVSGKFAWPSGAPASGGATPPPAGAFAASFKNPRGNAWWVEVDVSASGATLAGVDARVNGGAWSALAKTGWGSWAKSLHAPAGSKVEFRARSADAQTALSGPVAWPP